jgi:tetratricopeptide (TPR) repeat protein
MKRTILAGILAMAAGIACLAQAPAGKAPAQPKAKSQDELKAVQAMLTAQDPDSIIKAADDLQTRFADTQFKEAAEAMEAEAYHSKSDNIKAQIYAEQALTLNPKNLQANMLVGEILVQTTAPLALNRDEEYAKAQKCLTAAQDELATTVKPNPKMTDADWDGFKKETSARLHNDVGMLASARKNWDVAITEFKAAIAEGDQPAYQARLASTYQQAGKNAEAIEICNKLLADPYTGVPPAAVTQIKAFVTRVKNAATRASAPASAPAPAPPK